MFRELKEDRLESIIDSNDKVIVQFSAGWCGNCRIMKPKFKKLAAENEGMVFVEVDAEKNPNSRKLAQVNYLPTFAAFVKGECKDQVQTNKFDMLKKMVDAIADN